ncbi:MAG TPA: Fic/DOC family N-terminal domain-containing protein [Candidatus Babeliales bacterium]|nr:Fic/DOC family N-terminal domain-containing protein [Candidatus Babeliales bacterium]
MPLPLSPDPPIDMAQVYLYLDKAVYAVAELNGVAKSIPNISLFTYMYVRKEALLSPQTEGTHSFFADLILSGNAQSPHVAREDVEEV